MAKILFISHMFPNKSDYAYGKVILEQAISLSPSHDITVIAPVPYVPPFFKHLKKRYKRLKQIEKEGTISGIKVFYPRFLAFGSFLFCHTGFFMFLGIKRLVKRLNKKTNFDLIHAHFTIPDGFAGAKLKKLLNIPLIITLQATDLNYTIKKCPNKLLFAYKNASTIITPTPILAKTLYTLTAYKAFVIGYGIKKIKHTKKLQEKYQGKTILLTVSRLLKTKGIKESLQAFRILKKTYPNLIYIIIGTGAEEENLKKIVQELEMENVYFLGAKTHPEVLAYMQIADIFLLPSYQETFGLVYLEAMASMLPVIGCFGQGFDGIIKNYENGFLAKPKDYQSIVEIISFILTNPLKTKEIAINGKVLADDYTFEKIAEKLNNLYQQVLGAK